MAKIVVHKCDACGKEERAKTANEDRPLEWGRVTFESARMQYTVLSLCSPCFDKCIKGKRPIWPQET